MQQVLINLMHNGIEAMKEEGGELSVASTRTEDGELLVAVSDSGTGLPEAGPERIFEAYQAGWNRHGAFYQPQNH